VDEGGGEELGTELPGLAAANCAIGSALISWVVGLGVFIVLMATGSGSDVSPLLWMAGLTFVLNTTAIVLGRRASRGQSGERGATWLRSRWAVFLGTVGYLGTVVFLLAAAAIDTVDTLR